MASYTVEVDAYDPNTGLWLSGSWGSLIVSDISETSYTFEFPGSGLFRWRVWAVSPEEQESGRSGW